VRRIKRATHWSCQNLPAEVRPEEQGQVIIDWDPAVAQATHQPAT
jgi:hypothetical protein